MVIAHTVSSVQINGPALRIIRGLRGRSCASVARAVGCDISFLARVERGEKRGVNPGTFRALVRELDLVDGRAILVNPYDKTVTEVTVKEWGHNGAIVIPSQCNKRTAA